MRLGRQSLACLLAVVAGFVAVVPRAIAGEAPTTRRSIFDFDDDEPVPAAVRSDKNSAGARTASVALHSSQIITVQAPAAGSVRAKAVAAPVIKALVLKPLPDTAAQERVLKQVREQFKPEYRALGGDRSAAAQKLLLAGLDTTLDDETAFVLLKEARDMAAAGGDAGTGIAAARQIASRFSVDLTEMGFGVLTAASRSAASSNRSAEVASVAMNLLARANQTQQHEMALRIASIAEAAARAMRSPTLANNLQAIQKDIRSRKSNADLLPKAMETLKTAPTDADACAVVGRQLCFEEGKWEEGLAKLALGSDAPLKNLAKADLGNPTTPLAQADVASQWWAVAQSQPLTARLQMQQRAAYWYTLAKPGLLGERRDTANARIASAGKTLAHVVLMQYPSASLDTAKAHRERAALGGGEPLAGVPIKDPLVIAADKPMLLSGTLSIVDKAGKVVITLLPGAEIRGGTISLGGEGRLKLIGTAEKPAILRNVHVMMEINDGFTGENAIFDGCTFSKAGGWFTYHSSKWTFKNCVLSKCKFSKLDGTDYGFDFQSCRFIGMTFPEIQPRREKDKEFNYLKHLRRDWNIIRYCEFTECSVSPTVAWCAEDSSFIGCRFIPGDVFENDADFEWKAFLAETSGESPQAIFNIRPAPRGKVKIVPLDDPPQLPVLGKSSIPEITYSIRAVTRND